MLESSLLKATHSGREVFKKLALSNKLNKNKKASLTRRKINIHEQTYLRSLIQQE